ncbi:hypothetical protein FN976_20605 [Caenimonas sedimenti]|uniref:Helix-turn-helix domain-containing protein n=1 Tax=Caenimonas sedimenti TaxID=2596921 RepID=A0A562ZL64_9BURK|nr:hypothetical protein [Caenimonas sedimenti]TWO69137.1 hypothetical protein FN976_20605 [Caenimonas sedimenti]
MPANAGLMGRAFALALGTKLATGGSLDLFGKSASRNCVRIHLGTLDLAEDDERAVQQITADDDDEATSSLAHLRLTYPSTGFSLNNVYGRRVLVPSGDDAPRGQAIIIYRLSDWLEAAPRTTKHRETPKNTDLRETAEYLMESARTNGHTLVVFDDLPASGERLSEYCVGGQRLIVQPDPLSGMAPDQSFIVVRDRTGDFDESPLRFRCWHLVEDGQLVLRLNIDQNDARAAEETRDALRDRKIASLVEKGLSQAGLTEALGISQSMVSKELKRLGLKARRPGKR